MISLAFIMAFVAMSVGVIISIITMGAVDEAIACPAINEVGNIECEDAKSIGTLISVVLPVTLFFAVYMSMGGINSYAFGNKRRRNDLDEAREIGKYIGGRASNGSNIVLKRILLSIGLAKKKK